MRWRDEDSCSRWQNPLGKELHIRWLDVTARKWAEDEMRESRGAPEKQNTSWSTELGLKRDEFYSKSTNDVPANSDLVLLSLIKGTYLQGW